jgi:hypothetical protein
MKNWKTTLGGILTIISPIVESVLSGKINCQTAIPQIIIGIALLFAKDFNVSNTSTETSSTSYPQ